MTSRRFEGKVAFITGAARGQGTEPEDIAVAVACLASDEARHVTGIQLPVDLNRLCLLRH